MNNYCLPENYKIRDEINFFSDIMNTDKFQNEVYRYAKEVALNNNYNRIVDIGTGSGYKLIKYFNENETIGIDLEPTLSWLKEKYPNKAWCHFEELNKLIEYDLVICSDIIEHVLNPTEFIANINEFNFKHILFSTPDSLSMYGEPHFGPPSNSSHIMEWNMMQFNEYLSKFYIVEKHFKNNLELNTQVALCRKIN